MKTSSTSSVQERTENQLGALGKPINLTSVLADITRRFQPTEWRRPKARQLDQDFDEPPRCYYCKGDPDERGCHCHGLGYDRELPSVILTIWRDFHSLEVQAIADDERTKIVDAYAVVTEGEYKNGESVELDLAEQAEALAVLKEAE